MKKLLLSFAICLSLVSAHNIIPLPQKITSHNTKVANISPVWFLQNNSNFPNEKIKHFINSIPNYSISNQKKNHTIFSLIKTPSIPNEGYNLQINSQNITIEASTHAGFSYALETLKQLIIFSNNKIPALSINDFPNFSWRGMHLDVSRHFFSVNEIKKFLDLMAAYKMNVFHWHLTDGPGWRVEIKKYPRLTSVGAWRKNKTHLPWNWRDTEINPNGKQPHDYGGFYSQNQIKEIVQYAKSKNIMVVPEIEMPGHSYAALLAYPQFACKQNNIIIDGLRGKDVFCLGNENTITFLQDILSELIPLFPAPFFHIGADEVPLEAWSKCSLCKQKLNSLNSENFKSLQTDLVKKMATFLKNNGKTLIGWDEIVDESLPKDATIMVWRQGAFAENALALGHNIIFCPTNYSYFDYYQAPKENEPLAIGGMVTLKNVYSYSPPKNSIGKVLGGQGNVWTEYLSSMHQVEYMTWPRASALAERLWNQNTNNFENFKTRLQPHLKLWKNKEYNFRPLK